MSDLESPLDVEETAEQLDVDPDAIRGVVDHFEQRGRAGLAEEFVGEPPLIETIHAYWHAIAIVELTEDIGHTGVNRQPYALVNFQGQVIAFHPRDVENLEDLLDRAGLEANDA